MHFFMDHSIEFMGVGYLLYGIFKFVDANFVTHRKTLSPEDFVQLWVDLQWFKEKNEKK
jgi:hypothetical protein